MDTFGVDFFRQDTLTVAKALVGGLLIHDHASGERLVSRIVETEGYRQGDPAFHGWGLLDEATGELKREGRGAVLYDRPGMGYVYLCYGIHWLLNVVTEPRGTGGAVLIRAAEPLEGRDFMRRRRAAARRDVDLTNGPGKLCEAMDVDERFHEQMLTEAPLYFARPERSRPVAIQTSARIGITKGVNRPWRYFIQDHPYVSRGTPSDQKA